MVGPALTIRYSRVSAKCGCDKSGVDQKYFHFNSNHVIVYTYKWINDKELHCQPVVRHWLQMYTKNPQSTFSISDNKKKMRMIHEYCHWHIERNKDKSYKLKLWPEYFKKTFRFSNYCLKSDSLQNSRDQYIKTWINKNTCLEVNIMKHKSNSKSWKKQRF